MKTEYLKWKKKVLDFNRLKILVTHHNSTSFSNPQVRFIAVTPLNFVQIKLLSIFPVGSSFDNLVVFSWFHWYFPSWYLWLDWKQVPWCSRNKKHKDIWEILRIPKCQFTVRCGVVFIGCSAMVSFIKNDDVEGRLIVLYFCLQFIEPFITCITPNVFLRSIFDILTCFVW